MEGKRELDVVIASLINDIQERYNISYGKAEQVLTKSLLEYKVELAIMNAVTDKLNK